MSKKLGKTVHNFSCRCDLPTAPMDNLIHT